MSTKGQKERTAVLQGTLDLLILRTLLLGPAHGHPIAKRGWIFAEGGTLENHRGAKFYRLTAKGRRQWAVETSKWDRLTGAIAGILRPAKPEGEP